MGDFITGSVSVIIGEFGAGKTAFLSYWAYRQRRRHPDRPIYANYDLALPDGDPVRWWTDKRVLLGLTNCDILIDEAHLFFPARDWTKFGREFETYFSMVRHNGVRIMCVCQNLDQLDKYVKGVTQMLYVVTSWRRLGFFYVEGFPGCQRDPKTRIYYKRVPAFPLVLDLYDTLGNIAMDGI